MPMSTVRRISKSGGARLISLPKEFPEDWRYVAITMEKISEEEYVLRLRKVK